jgi:cytochrome c oxidase assembly protein subunit 15
MVLECRERQGPRRLFWIALAVAATMFLLIFLGGLVTTQDAGMAVPDWPGTYGYNMFAYPWTTWLYGPMDLLIEHGHRLLGTVVGLLAIFLTLVAWFHRSERWLFWFALGLLLAIIGQGVLGGVRVLRDARTLAMVHGCTGPLVFGLASAMVLCTSRSWKLLPRCSVGGRLRWWLVMQTALAILQLLVGAQLRHCEAWLPPSSFTGIVHLHLTLAGLLTIVVTTNSLRIILGQTASHPMTGRLAWLMLGLLGCQLLLGVATWIVNYALPWQGAGPLASYTIGLKGYWESWITTCHQATGSLIIASSLALALVVFRQSTLSKPLPSAKLLQL